MAKKKPQPDDAITYPVSDEAPAFKILIIDIETSANLAYVWRVWQQNVSTSQLVKEKEVISFAAKWYGSDEVIFSSVFHDTKKKMVKKAWDLLNEADVVVHYNGKKFDIPHLNQEFLLAGMPPPVPFRQVDLLTTVRREYNFGHNKLDHVTQALGIGSKVEHEGFELWVACMKNDPDAWERMKAYNIHDVGLTEQLYKRILPWITQHPSHAAINGDMRCTNCGSSDLKKNGFQYTLTGRYQRYRCGSCGAAVRDTKRQSGAPVTRTSSW